MKNYLKQTIQTYNEQAQNFSDTRKNFQQVESIKKFTALLLGKNILDLGCGPGRDAQTFVQKGYQVTGLDLSKNLLSLAKIQVPQATFIHADMLDMPFKNNTFDGIWASAALVHFHAEDLKIAFEQAYRVLKPGGILFASIKEGTGGKHEADPRLNGAVRYFGFHSQHDVENIVKHIGFDIIESFVETKNNMLRNISWVVIFIQKPR